MSSIHDDLVKSLNSKQESYVNLELPDPTNGEYLLSVFHMVPGGKFNVLQAAAEIAAESSTGTNFKVTTETSFSKTMNCTGLPA